MGGEGQGWVGRGKDGWEGARMGREKGEQQGWMRREGSSKDGGGRGGARMGGEVGEGW